MKIQEKMAICLDNVGNFRPMTEPRPLETEEFNGLAVSDCIQSRLARAAQLEIAQEIDLLLLYGVPAVGGVIYLLSMALGGQELANHLIHTVETAPIITLMSGLGMTSAIAAITREAQIIDNKKNLNKISSIIDNERMLRSYSKHS